LKNQDSLQPFMPSTRFLDFIELEGFSDDWHDLKLDDEALFALQSAIMSNPKGGAVMQGLGGLRKLRFAPPRWKMGKRGAVRVGYLYLEAYSIVFLVTAYSKVQRDDLPASERHAIKRVIVRIEKELAKQRQRQRE